VHFLRGTGPVDSQHSYADLVEDGGIVANKRRISADKAKQVGMTLGLDWKKVDLEQFRRGLEVELEHGARDPETNVTNDDLTLTGKIAWAHLKEFPDYYTRLDKLEAEADVYWAPRR
jgi:hypothetical protein